MTARLLPLLLIAALLVPLAGCGSDSSSSTGSSTGGAKSQAALLNGWSDTTLAALAALQARAKAGTSRDKAAYDTADAKLQTELKKVTAFPAEAQSALGSDASSADGKVIIADANAWKAWAALLLKKSLSDKESVQAGQLGGKAAQAHLDAYKEAGVEVPADFAKQAGGGGAR